DACQAIGRCADGGGRPFTSGGRSQAFDNRGGGGALLLRYHQSTHHRPAAHMPRTIEWEIPAEIQPKPEDCAFDLDRALGAVLGVHATVPEDAFTAGTLGTERAGSGVLIRKD